MKAGVDMDLHTDLPGGRRELRLRTGPLAVAVTEVPAPALSDGEWRSIQLARTSYADVWGGGDGSVVMEDAFDGRGEHSRTWDVRHYLAWARDARTGDARKLLTARKVAVRAAALSAAQRSEPAGVLPLDVRFWRMRTPAGCVPLWHPLRAFLRRLAPDDELAEFRFAAMGRFATYPHGERQAASMRECTAIAWAAIQILAAHCDRSQLHLRTVRPDFPGRVLAVRDRHGARVAPVFPRTEDTLGLRPGSVELDGSSYAVQQHKVAMPGYFVDGHGAAAALASLLDRGEVAASELHGAIHRVLAEDARRPELMAWLEMSRDHHRLAELLTRPRSFKHLAPLLSGAATLSRISTEDFRNRIVHEPRTVPFSSAATPGAWSITAWTLMETVVRRHTGAGAGPMETA